MLRAVPRAFAAFDAIAHQLGLACAHRARRKVLRQPRKPAVRIACVVGGKTSRDIDAFRARHAIAASRAGHTVRFLKLHQHARNRVETRARSCRAGWPSSNSATRGLPVTNSRPPARYRSYPKATWSPGDDSTPTRAPKRQAYANADRMHHREQRAPAEAICLPSVRPKAAPSQTPRDLARRRP